LAPNKLVDQVDWTEPFIASYEEAREAKAWERARLKAKAARAEPREDDLPHMERAKDERIAVSDRLEHGFSWGGGTVACDPAAGQPGWWRESYVYRGLPSTTSAMLRLFVTQTRAGRKLAAGAGPSSVRGGAPKVTGLDAEQVLLNEVLRGAVGVKLKGTWPSMAAFRAAVERAGVPLPNLVVAGGDEQTGSVEDPQLLWLLLASVNFGSKGTKSPQRAWRTARAALIRKLAGLGAVEESEAASLNIKNPVSTKLLHSEEWFSTPYQLGATTAEHPLPSLKMAKPTAAEPASGVPDSGSVAASAFDKLRWPAYKAVVPFFASGDRDGFAARVRELAVVAGADAGQTAKIIQWTWEHHDPAKLRRRPLGPCADMTRGLSVREAQAVGGRYGASVRRDKNVAKMAEGYALLFRVQGGTEPTKAAVAAFAGLHPRTASRRWDDVREAAVAVLQRLDIQSGVILLSHAAEGTSFVPGAASPTPKPLRLTPFTGFRLPELPAARSGTTGSREDDRRRLAA
jgi:hypothetical protein